MRFAMARLKKNETMARQMADVEKRAKAHFVVDTSRGLEDARRQVRAIIAALKQPNWRERLDGGGERRQ